MFKIFKFLFNLVEFGEDLTNTTWNKSPITVRLGAVIMWLALWVLALFLLYLAAFLINEAAAAFGVSSIGSVHAVALFGSFVYLLASYERAIVIPDDYTGYTHELDVRYG